MKSKRIRTVLLTSTMLTALLTLFTITASAELNGEGTAENPYTISTMEELEEFRDSVNGENTYTGRFIKLTGDIDLSSKYANGKSNWVPIGMYKGGTPESSEFDWAYKFEGTFDGAGYTINGIYSRMTGTNSKAKGYFMGLFGCVGSSGTVKDVQLNGEIITEYYEGYIAAINHGTISGCTIDVRSLQKSSKASGGICAVNFGTIEKCTRNHRYVSFVSGGIVGINESTGVINNCYTLQSASSGGIAAENKGLIKNCYTSCKGDTTGCIAGSNSGTIEYCFFNPYGNDTPAVGTDSGTTDAYEVTDYQMSSGELAYKLQSVQEKVNGTVPLVWGIVGNSTGFSNNEGDRVFKIEHMAKDGSGYKKVATSYATTNRGVINMPSLPDTDEVKFRYWSLTQDENGTNLSDVKEFTEDMTVYAVGSEKVTDSGKGLSDKKELKLSDSVNIELKDYVKALSGDESTNYNFSIIKGILPTGLSLDNGKIIGTVKSTGTYEVTFGVLTDKVSLMSVGSVSVSDGYSFTLTFDVPDTDMIFDENGGDTPAKRWYDADKEEYGFPWVNPTREGYTFGGWYTEDGTADVWGEEYTLSNYYYNIKHKKVYAKWVQPMLPTRDMFDVTVDNIDKSKDGTERITVTPKVEYEDIFDVERIKFYDLFTEDWVDTLTPGKTYNIYADVETLDPSCASPDNIKITRVQYYGDGNIETLYESNIIAEENLKEYETQNFEVDELYLYGLGITDTAKINMVENIDGDVLNEHFTFDKDDDTGIWKVTWDDDTIYGYYNVRYMDSGDNELNKSFEIKRCPLYPKVSDTEQEYSTSGNAIKITSTGTKSLDSSKLKVEYYPIDEKSGKLASLTPIDKVTEPGKYMYVISIDYDSDELTKNYEILFRYVPTSNDIPSLKAFDNVGYFTVTKAGADITTQTNAVHTYDGTAYDVSGLFTVNPLAGDKEYSLVTDSDTDGEGTLSGNVLSITKAGKFKIKLNTTETAYCSGGEATAVLTVKKGVPDEPIYPTASDITYGDTLESSILSGGSTNGTFGWKDKSILPTVTNDGYEVVFTPIDTDLYAYDEAELTKKVAVKVNPLKVIIEWTNTDNLIYDGTAKAVSAKVKNAVSTDCPTLTLGGNYSAVNAGDYTATVTAVNNENYTLTGVANLTCPWKIRKAEAETEVKGNTPLTYGDILTLTAEVKMSKAKSANADEVNFYVVEDEDAVLLDTVAVSYDDETKKDSGKATLTVNTSDKDLIIGDNVITAEYGGSVNLNGSEKDTITVTLNKKEIGLTWSGNDNLVYDGDPKNVTATTNDFVDGDDVSLTVTGGNETNADAYEATAVLSGEDAKYYTLPTEFKKPYTIEKAPSSVTTPPTKAENLVYTGDVLTLLTADGTAEGGTIKYSLDGTTFDYDFANIPKVKNADDYKIWYKVIGDENHNDTAADFIEIKVAKKPINTAIAITAPAKNAAPQTTIDTDEYTAAIAWTPTIDAGGYFAQSTQYSATITITPMANYTTDGITAYTIDGAESVNPNSDGTVTAVFPTTSGSSSGGGGSSRYTVKFDTDGGSTITNQIVKKNTKATEPTEPTKEGYIFDGWYSDSKFTAEYDFDTKVTKNTTLYAKWVEDEIQEPSDDKKDDNDDNERKPSESDWKNPFTDVKETDWFFDNVKYVNQNGLMSGTTNTTFAPNDSLTRAMLVTVLWRAEGKPNVDFAMPFTDVDENEYYTEALRWASSENIVNGVTETEFAPDMNITREQIATIVYRYSKYKGIAPTGAWAIKLDYADVSDISDYAAEGVMYCTMKNIMQGKDNNMFSPKDNATRAEIAAILNRFIENNM